MSAGSRTPESALGLELVDGGRARRERAVGAAILKDTMLAVDPMLLSTARALPTNGAGWVLEPKWDGIRLVAAHHPRRGPVLMSRHGTSLTQRQPELAAAIAELEAGTVIDGELVALSPTPGGGAVQDFAGAASVAVRVPGAELAARLQLCAFDLPRLGGEELVGVPQSERSSALERLLAELAAPTVVTTPQLPVEQSALASVIATGFEGAVLKRIDARYQPGTRSTSWRKIKARHTAAVIIAAARSAGHPGQADRILVRDELGTWPALIWPGPIARALAELGPAARGRAAHITFSRRDANGAPREARISLLGELATRLPEIRAPGG